MSNKILNSLEIKSNEINYRTMLAKVCQNLLNKTKEEKLKWVFDLIDEDGNDEICIKDLNAFSSQFAGNHNMLMTDFKDLTDFINKKRQSKPQSWASKVTIADRKEV